jgi:hypothetical protein
MRVVRGKISHEFNAGGQRQRQYQKPEGQEGRERTPGNDGGTANTQGSMIGRPKGRFPRVLHPECAPRSIAPSLEAGRIRKLGMGYSSQFRDPKPRGEPLGSPEDPAGGFWSDFFRRGSPGAQCKY